LEFRFDAVFFDLSRLKLFQVHLLEDYKDVVGPYQIENGLA
jgi:hypothetical protein